MPRKLVVQIWYPATGTPGKPLVPYAYEITEMNKRGFRKALKGKHEDKIARIDLIRTHAVPHATLAAEAQPFPLVIFGHGYGASRGGYSFLCEEIASHGYVVAMVMHTYVTDLTRFANGSETLLTRDRTRETFDTCAADIRFMLDLITAGSCGATLTDACNFNQIGIVGHSLGGMMAAQLCRHDNRIKAGISLDGALFGTGGSTPFHKPFMFMRTPHFYQMFDDAPEVLAAITDEDPALFQNSLERFCHNNQADSYHVVVQGAEHNTFADEALLVHVFRDIFQTKNIDLDAGSTTPEALQTIRDSIVAFFNHHLKQQPMSLPAMVQQKVGDATYEWHIAD